MQQTHKIVIDKCDNEAYNSNINTIKRGENMSEKERKDIQEMVETAKYLAENDPQGLLIAKSNMDILKARSDMETVVKKTG